MAIRNNQRSDSTMFGLKPLDFETGILMIKIFRPQNSVPAGEIAFIPIERKQKWFDTFLSTFNK